MTIMNCEICDRKFEGTENQIAIRMAVHKRGEVHMFNAHRHTIV